MTHSSVCNYLAFFPNCFQVTDAIESYTQCTYNQCHKSVKREDIPQKSKVKKLYQLLEWQGEGGKQL